MKTFPDNPQFGVIGNSSSSPLSGGVSSDSSSATASISANNKHSIYIIDNHASIIIHNHHFDASQFKKSSASSNQSMTSIKRPTTGGISQNLSQVRFDDTVTRYSDSNVGAVDENNSTFFTSNDYAPVQRLYSAHTDSGQFTDVTSRDSSVNYAKSTSNFGHFSSANLDQTRSSSSSFVYNRPNASKYVTLNNGSSTLPNSNRAYLIYNNNQNNPNTLNNQASSKCYNLSNRSFSSIDSGIYPTPYLGTTDHFPTDRHS